jgi:hypothetical protein
VLTADHPNAIWLTGLYRGMHAIESDTSLDHAQREERTNLHLAEFGKRWSPDLIIHTGGIKLAVTGNLAFMRAYGRRRASLADSFLPLALDQILADDHFGIIHGIFRTTRGVEVWERIGMGAWRFEQGMAVEHWELSDGPKWDAFYLAGDPDSAAMSGIEFWTKE